ncbi:nucleotidyltransferase family protein [Streptomyces hawaiiensis]|uniref:nucleotidyltransferase family protein n=1 Tax=Streptomyces hawaiiensis TaxID=67305 RepID=UPI00364B3237
MNVSDKDSRVRGTAVGHPHKREIDLLLALSDPWMTEEGAEETRETLRTCTSSVDWAWLVDQGARHRVLPLIGSNVKRYRLNRTADGTAEIIPNHWLFTTVFEGNRRRNESLRTEFALILERLNATDIPYAVRKGPLLCERLFPDPGMRRTNDFDLLVKESDASAVASLLHGLGYEQGALAADGRVQPFERSTQAFWRLHVNNALPFMKATTEPGVEVFIVDLCLSVLPGRAQRTSGSQEFLDRSVPVVTCGVDSRSLSQADELLDLCQHLYKEADTGFYISIGRDIALSKFIDVVSAVKNADDGILETFVERAHHYGVARNVYFAIVHAAEFYPGSIPGWVEERLRPGDGLAYIDEYGHLEGNVRNWQSTFMERAFDTRRIALMEGGSSAPLH